MQCFYNSDSVTADKINSLLAPFLAPHSLSPEQIGQVQLYLDLLIKWNAKVNLTAIRSEEEIVARHFGESFFAVRQIAKIAPCTASVVDVGSGAGFPGLPIKIWLPEIKLTLVESNNKKVAFLREAIRLMNLENAAVLAVRALGLTKTEVLAIRAQEVKAKFDLVTLRAVERFEAVLPVAAGLLQADGFLALLIGEAQIETARHLLPNFDWSEPIPIPGSRQRVLLMGRN